MFQIGAAALVVAGLGYVYFDSTNANSAQEDVASEEASNSNAPEEAETTEVSNTAATEAAEAKLTAGSENSEQE